MSLNKHGESFLQKALQPPADKQEVASLFNIKTAGTWMQAASLRPRPKMIFGELWFEGELCICFAESNIGKSILAVQIADSISRGFAIMPMPLELAAQKVLYFDFELSDMQFYIRYADGNISHNFSDNFLRCEIDPEADTPSGYKSFEDFVIMEIERAVIAYGCKVLIIDNLTFLGNETERAKDALVLMKLLQKLKKKHKLSMLVLAHTPKRDSTAAITKKDLAGSANIINFCDSAFSVAKGKEGERYLKQQKVRNVEERYNAKNVLVFDVVKENSFLHFRFSDYDDEYKLLAGDTEISESKIMELSDAGYSLRDIAAAMNTYPMRVKRVIDKVLERRASQEKAKKEFEEFITTLDKEEQPPPPF